MCRNRYDVTDMRCPHCDHAESRVIETRENCDGDVTRRRRECTGCGERFTTYERVETPALTVVKSDGREEGFRREKLAEGIRKACKKRPVDEDAIEAIVDDIEADLKARGERTIESSEIGDTVVERLKEVDEVAYLRFASIYNSFDDVSAFQEEVETLKTDS